MAREQIDKEEVTNDVRTLKCHTCSGKILRGEKYIWFWGTRGYINICWKCMIKIGEKGQSMDEWNKEYLAMPLKERLKRLKCLQALEPTK